VALYVTNVTHTCEGHESPIAESADDWWSAYEVPYYSISDRALPGLTARLGHYAPSTTTTARGSAAAWLNAHMMK
jgi:hypothetical protein